MRVRESSLVSGGFGVSLAGWCIPTHRVLSRSVHRGAALHGATVQLPSKLQPAEGTGRPFRTDTAGENSIAKDERQ